MGWVRPWPSARMPAKRLSAPPRQAVEGLEDAVVFR